MRRRSESGDDARVPRVSWPRRYWRSSADSLSDDELLAKLKDLGLDADRDGVERLCEGALSAEQVARPMVKKLKLSDDMVIDWVWISLCALWQRWWPDRLCLELLDDKMQAGYVQDTGHDTHAAAVTWLDAWADVLRLCDAAGISSIEEFDERFPLTQSVFNWSQDLEMALDNAGRDDGEIRQALIEFCEESFRRFPHEDQLLTENRRRTMAQAYFDAGMTEKSEELFRSWLDTDPAWGWGWIGWADCYLPWGGRTADFGQAEELLHRGYRVPGVRDRADIAARLKEVSSSGPTARRVKVGRNDPCSCGSGKKFKKCCGSPAAEVSVTEDARLALLPRTGSPSAGTS